MGYLLKEALKTLCGVKQWSYAVFWKIGCQNPMLLIWEDSYYEPMPCSSLPLNSRIESSEMAFEDWEGCWVSAERQTPQFGVRAEDKVPSLINKMMLGNRVKIVGQGLVGRAAFTGDHAWILSDNRARETHPPEVQNEVCQQFSAGIKTIAVIPILTQGVVQVGSSLAIMENMKFVDDVKSLILQLACIPGALLSTNHTTKEPVPEFGAPVFHKRSITANSSGTYKVKDSVPTVADSFNLQTITSQALELVGQPRHSVIGHIRHNLQGTFAFQTPKVVTSQDDLCTSRIVPAMKPSYSFGSHIENEETGANVTQLNPQMWLNQKTFLSYQKSGFDGQSCVGLSSANNRNLRIDEEQMLSHVNNNLSTSGGNIMSQLRTSGGLSSSGSQFHSGASNHPRPVSTPYSCQTAHMSTNADISYSHLAGCGLNAGSSNTDVSISGLTNHLTSKHLFLGKSDFRQHTEHEKCSQIEVSRRKESSGNGSFKTLAIPLAHVDELTNLNGNISGMDHDSQKHGSRNQSSRSKNEDEWVQTLSGNDLFDILGVDFKNKLFQDSQNSFLDSRSDTNITYLNKDKVTFSHLQDENSELYSMSGGNSDTGTFCATGTDQLLDAVVNTLHAAAKEREDDSLSCRTTFTKISSSSNPNPTTSLGQVSVSDEMLGEFSGIPKSLEKLAAIGSYSFKSESRNEDSGKYSQGDSICGSQSHSQLSSWVEQGHSMQQISGASTAYSKRSDEVSKSNCKRLKPGENPRPRPKDRQMIQDRMKELREIVPNGAKCSIDALLERTIKHMLFLQSVTKHADKLKQTGESKMINSDGGLLLKNNFDGGRTWACEVGSQSMVCPIVVEDLNPPRQMLVEMLCEERGLFLEIADIIRGLGLTILKGVMETRNDKIWARFAVEANRDVTRMEIFLSLVHLLEQTVKSSAAPGNDIENDNTMVHQSFHPVASIPASLQ